MSEWQNVPHPGRFGWYQGEKVRIKRWETEGPGKRTVHAVKFDGTIIEDEPHMFQRTDTIENRRNRE